MIKFFKNFRKDEDGAVTVDWVVLTAAVVAMGVGAFATIESTVDTTVSSITGDMTDGYK